jgi:hypothetical protein
MVPFVGPSYNLPELGVDSQRSINMHLQKLETPNDKAPGFILVSMPGRKEWMSGIGAPIRAEFATAAGSGQRAFSVAGDTLYEVLADKSRVFRGTLLTSTGPVDIEYGNTQLVVVDGPNGYVLTLGTNVFTQITAPGWRGSARVAFLNNYFVFCDPDTGVYYWSLIDDATNLDALDFATAESQPDHLIAIVRDNEELRLLGASSCEMATTSGTTVFAKRQGASIDVGCLATHSARSGIDNGTIFLGGDKNGGGIVYMIRGYQAQRISTVPIETMLGASTDLSAATSYTLQLSGMTFYFLDAPGLETTLAYEVSTGGWFEVAEIDDYGQFVPSKVTCHMYAFGKHLVGDSDGNISELDRGTYQNLGSTLVRERISPHYVSPGLGWNSPAAFVLDCKTGAAPIGVTPMVEMSYSKDGGATWSNPRLKTMGAIGVRLVRIVWRNIGRFKQRIWKLRCSANAPFTITDVFVGDPDRK